MMNEEQFAATHAKLGIQGGFTVNPRSGADITSGISVAPRGNELKVPITQSAPSTLADYAGANVNRWTPGHDESGVLRGRNASLGGWRSEDSDYFDTPTVYPNNPRGMSGARKQMVLSGQEAGFHLDTFQEIFNPFHPEARRKQGMETHELADAAGRGREGADFAMRQPEVQAWVNGPREQAAAQREQASRSGAHRGQGKSH